MSETEATKQASTSETEANKRASYRRVRTVAAFALAGGGAALAWCSWPGPAGSSVARYIYGNGAHVAAVVDRVRAAIGTDVLFVLGYSLLLGGLAWIFLLWAISVSAG
jgi:hypothetical protein